MTTHSTMREYFYNKLIADISHIAFFTNFKPFSETDIIDSKYEIGRTTDFTINVINNSLKIDFTIPTSIGNCQTTTTSTGSTTTVINLVDASFLESTDDTIEFIIDGKEIEREIISKSSNTITLGEPLENAPSSGITARQKIKARSVILNGDVGALTGNLCQSEIYSKFKNSSMTIKDSIIINFEGN
jgi:hypothetical protein